jgi:hypothetical protein
LSRRQRQTAKLRPVTPKVDPLEARELLSTTAGFVARPLFEVGPLVAYNAPPAGAYTPAQVQQAYGFNKVAFGAVKGDGTGQTIAIVDAYDDPNIQADLDAFDAPFGLPGTTVTRVDQNGGTSYPATDPSGGWELEESLDVEWAHAVAPGAKILLVEANSTYDSDLLPAVDYAAAHANVVSLSWGGGEYSGETSNDTHFSKPGVAFVAASGDNGAPIEWPAAAPDVLAVGGTSLTLGPGNAWAGESGWSGSGGGPSAYEPQPSYQAGVVTQTTMRANPDVAYDASSATGFAVYDSFAYSGTSYGWLQVGGTSAGAPQWAALLAIADQGRALNNQPAVNGASPTEALTTLYKNAANDFHDITSGTSTGSPTYNAGPGYDYVTGLGSPKADLVVQSLDGAVAPASNDHLAFTATPSSDVAGQSLAVTVVAQTASGATDAGYRGTVHFTSSDAQAALPSDYTFTASDNGSHTFTVTLKTAGTQSVTVSDTASGLSATTSGVSVTPAAPTSLTAQAASTSQINLSWTSSTGATSYLIERSLNGSTWTQIASTTGTTYAETGLSAGTTYSYRVRASGGGTTSSYSNTATATTTAATAATTDTLWANSYTPSENAYSSGYYEVGVRFSSSQAGTVTGVRFYKKSWMGGSTHVGHLWSSTGQLLATATFTNETSSGWQQVSFSTPVTIAANTNYVVSFSTGGGYFGISTTYFQTTSITNGPLNAPAGANGVYHSGTGVFPSVSGNGMNFWADVVFAPSTTSSAVASTSSHPSGSAVVYAAPVTSTGTGSNAGTSTTSRGTQTGTVLTGNWPYRRAVPQALTFASSRRFGG